MGWPLLAVRGGGGSGPGSVFLIPKNFNSNFHDHRQGWQQRAVSTTYAGSGGGGGRGRGGGGRGRGSSSDDRTMDRFRTRERNRGRGR